tara:strand:+ start:798 stop:1385 length:588 start_codon:yes stop_codon:yes gene_type:complete
MELLILLLLIPIVRGLIFFFDWRYLVKVCDKHSLYLKGVGDSATDEAKEISGKASDWITEHTTEIKRRVEKSGINNPVHSFMDAKGYGYVGQEQMSTLDNLLYLNQNIQSSAVTVLKRSRGHFRNEAIKSINPLFWLETLFFLPKAIVSASGIDASSKLADTGLKVTQIIYWLVILGAVVANPDLLKVLIETIKT